jgi:hypothetical protein
LLLGLLVLDVEPFLAPVLDGLGHLEVEVFGFWPNRDDGPANVMDGGPRRVAPDEKYAPP